MKNFNDLLTRCCASCSQHSNCKGFTMLGRTCWLKKHASGYVSKVGKVAFYGGGGGGGGGGSDGKWSSKCV